MHRSTYRRRVPLDGRWRFHIDPDGGATSDHLTSWRTIEVPGPWQAQFPDLRQATGVGWYHRTFSAPPWSGAAVLHFGAVDHAARAWLNGTLVGEHEGGYLPFEFDIGHLLEEDNELLVRVEDPTDDRQRYPNGPFSEIPHGKQSWYGPLSGIWQSVWLEHRHIRHIRDLQVSSHIDGRVRVGIQLSAPAPGTGLVLRIIGPEGNEVASQQVSVTDGSAVEATATVPDPALWSPDHPVLYRTEVHLTEAGETVDLEARTFGFRSIEAVDGRLLLNGQPLYLRAALDQDYYPDTLATVPSLDFLESQARKAKELGLNGLRCHIKVPDPRYYDVADRYGLLVWTELPSWRQYSDAAAERARETLAGMVARDGHHPSIIAWTVVNEDWGTDLVHEPEQRRWLVDTVRWLKELDPDRLVVDNSACAPNFHVETDIEDYHEYCAIPDHRHKWDRFVSEFATRASWTFGPGAEGHRTGREPLVVSEFGNWGLPDIEGLADAAGTEPWWFETGHEWESGVVHPHGIEQRFRTWHLNRVFGDLPSFVTATQWQQFRALQYQIASIRRRPEIVGYVVTELTDTHWEPNGLLDARRNRKTFHRDFRDLNADTALIAEWERTAYWVAEKVRLDLYVAHAGGTSLDGARIRWRCGSAHGELPVPPVAPGAVRSVGDVVFTPPTVATSQALRWEAELVGGDGVPRTSTSLDLSLAAPRTGPALQQPVWAGDEELAVRLGQLGYELADLPDAGVVVTRQVDARLAAHVRQGGRLLALVDRAGELCEELPGIESVARAGTHWQGDWASTFAWLRRDGPFAGFPGGPLLDFAFDRVVPNLVLTGFEPWEFEANVHAGMVVGWVHAPVALAASRRYGRGEILATTFRLVGEPQSDDPTAVRLLDALLETVTS